MASWLTWQAWFELALFDIVGVRGLSAQKRLVEATSTRVVASPSADAITAAVDAMQKASRRYLRRPQCLQRSVVVTRLLRKQGVEADLVIGCHLAPLRGHAWVEVAGDVVSDDMDDLPYFCILDRW